MFQSVDLPWVVNYFLMFYSDQPGGSTYQLIIMMPIYVEYTDNVLKKAQALRSSRLLSVY